MKNFSISESLSKAWDLLRQNILLVVLSFIVGIPTICSQGMEKIYPLPGIASPEDIKLLFTGALIPLLGSSFVFQIIAYALEGALTNACLTVVKGGKADFNCFNMQASTYVKYICAMICYGILVSIGMIFCIIPGIILAIRFMFVPTIIIDDPNCGFTDAFQRSWNMTRGNSWNLFALLLVTVLICIIGILCCCVGILVAIPITCLASTIIYMELKPEDDVIIEEVQ